MAELYYLPQFKQVNLVAPSGITAVQTSGIKLSDVDGIDTTKPGIICIDWSLALDTSVAEWITYTSIDANNELVGVTRGQEGFSAKTHGSNAVIAWTYSKSHVNNINDDFLVGHTTDGSHIANLPLTTPKITTSIKDANGNEVIKTPATASAVNEITVTNSATLKPVEINPTGDDTNISMLLGGKGTGIVIPKLASPRGFLINGKIVPSVASNNLTVAIKGLDGNDPSATNPVYCRIGDTIQSITSALSVTKNAGTNWCNAGSTELAAKEIDYFVYLGYNATDGVVIGFSRIPYAQEYDNFSTTSTSEKYCAISTITNAAAGDDYEVIGRFAATLSAGVGYTWSVPTFTNKNLIQKPIYETRWLTYTPVLAGIAGGTVPVFTTTITQYKVRNDSCDSMVAMSGDGGADGVGANDLTCSVPIGLHSDNSTAYPLGVMTWYGNGTTQGTGFNQRYSDTVLQLRFNPAATITCATFPAGNRWLYIKSLYKIV